jgi:hypothetical protein
MISVMTLMGDSVMSSRKGYRCTLAMGHDGPHYHQDNRIPMWGDEPCDSCGLCKGLHRKEILSKDGKRGLCMPCATDEEAFDDCRQQLIEDIKFQWFREHLERKYYHPGSSNGKTHGFGP